MKTLKQTILDMDVMPSMRSLMVAGPAGKRCNVSSYNCAYVTVDSVKVFDETMYILMSGTGVGYSVERQYINQLPVVPEELHDSETTIHVRDSKIGWATAYREFISLLYAGNIPRWDLSKVRPAGARLKTMGGRACLTGDTKVYRSGKKNRVWSEISINDLVALKGKDRHFQRIKLRSVNEQTGELYYNNLIDIIDNGIADVYEIVTEHGYKIKATSNHRFMDALGNWKYLEDFSIGEEIAVNGSEKKTGSCKDCGTNISRRSLRCKPCNDTAQVKKDALPTTARQRKEKLEYRKDYCEFCGSTNVRFEVHHVDENPHNNAHENLLNLCSKCHQELHGKLSTFGDGFAHRYMSWDKIVSVSLIGTERVYDLSMAAPNHNFIANGFVSHNSGPQPLDELFRFTVACFRKAVGRKLNSLECHDLMCKIADIVVVGGVRRSALISLSNLTDERMRGAKAGQWWEEHPERALANNSVCYTEKPDISIFMKEWSSLYDSKSGERGIFNRVAATKKVAESGRRDTSFAFGCNPCSEIILRPRSFCNLTEVIVRPEDNLATLREKVRIATILGTLQSTLTDFRYLTKEWKNNCEEERLLGVSLTGIMDHPVLSGNKVFDIEMFEGDTVGTMYDVKAVLHELKEVAIETNKEWAGKLGINPSTAITCVKPSGTVSQLVDSASGIHPRYSDYYIRTVRSDNKDPITAFMKDQGVPWEPDITKPETTTVFSFPMKAPEGSITREGLSAMEQLELWKVYQDTWCEHKPSQTIYYKEEDFLKIGAWVYENFDEVSGVSFLPHTDHVYKQAPYQEITKEVYEELIEKMPVLDWEKLTEYEDIDTTESVKEYACSGDKCELV